MAEHVKAMFLFSCFTGLRFSDVVNIKKENVILTDDRPRIAFNVKKTDRAHIVPLAPKAIEIIKNQRPVKTGQDTVFPAYTNQAVNRELKDILKLAGINKHISFHCARHTFASNHVEAKTSVFNLKDLLGHKNISQTQIYAKSLDTDLFGSMNALALKY